MRKTLIDRAAILVGGYANLARAIGASDAQISRMRHGKRTVSPKWIIRMCALLGEDATSCLLDEIARKHHD